jgi:hypothetical protein
MAPSSAGSTAVPQRICRSGPRSVHIWPRAWQDAQRTCRDGKHTTGMSRQHKHGICTA